MRGYTNYNSSITLAYKQGYIFSAHYDGGEVIRVCVDNYAYSVQVKSMHAAKLMITKHANKLKEV